MSATQAGNLPMMKLLLQNGADVHAPSSVQDLAAFPSISQIETLESSHSEGSVKLISPVKGSFGSDTKWMKEVLHDLGQLQLVEQETLKKQQLAFKEFADRERAQSKFKESLKLFCAESGTRKAFGQIEELFQELDPDDAFLTKLLQMKIGEITPDFCKKRILDGCQLWKQCQDLYLKSRGECNSELLKMVMGFAIGIIGNFASHLRRDFKFDAEMLEKILEQANTESKAHLPFGVERCIVIGKKYRHLNKIKKGDELVKADISWEQEIEFFIRKWGKDSDLLPAFTTFRATGSNGSDSKAKVSASRVVFY